MTRWSGLRLAFSILAASLIVFGCTSGDTTRGGSGPRQTAEATPTAPTTAPTTMVVPPPAAPAADPSPGEFPGDYTLASIETVEFALPGAELVDTIVAVGITFDDPRFFELSRYEVAVESELTPLLQLGGPASDAVTVELGSAGSFAFVDGTGEGGGSMRPSLQLMPHGPDVNATFRSRFSSTSAIVGGSAWLQPAAVAQILDTYANNRTALADNLPHGMQLIIEEPLGAGTQIGLDSTLGDISIEIYESVSRHWFDYITRADAKILPPDELLTPGVAVSIQQPVYYLVNGEAAGRARLTLWSDDGRLMVVHHPRSLPVQRIGELVAQLDGLRAETIAKLTPAAPTAPPTTAPEPPETAPPGVPGSGAPTPARMLEFQAFVERMRGIEVGQPISFDFVDAFPVDAASPMPISTDLWIVAKALGLTDDGQTQEGANQARADRLRGVPGLVVLQPTQYETEVVVVHEMVHVLDPYDEGRLFMTAVAVRGGEAMIGDAFNRPPVSSEQVLFVDAWLDNDAPLDVESPSAPDGAFSIAEGTLGAYILSLAAREGGAADHLAVVEPWAGDSYVAYEMGSDLCVRVTIALDTADAAVELARVLSACASVMDVDGNVIDGTFCAD